MKIINFFKIGLISSLLLAGTSALAQKIIVVKSLAKAPTTLSIDAVTSQATAKIKALTGLNKFGTLQITSIKLSDTREVAAASSSQNENYMSIQTTTQVTVNEANSSKSPKYYSVSYTITKIPTANFGKVLNAVNEAIEDAIIYAVCNTTVCPS